MTLPPADRPRELGVGVADDDHVAVTELAREDGPDAKTWCLVGAEQPKPFAINHCW